MRLFSNFIRYGSRHTFKRLQKGNSPSEEQSLPTVDFILVDGDEETESFEGPCKNAIPLEEYSAFYAEGLDIPSTFHSNTPLSATCPSSNFLDLRATYPSLPLPMGSSNGPELCVNASFNGYFTTLLVPSVWLVLGSYVFVATMIHIFHMSKKRDAGPESPIDDIDLHKSKEIPVYDTLVPGIVLPTAEEVLEYTLKQYGHLSDFDQDDDPSQSSQYPPPPNPKPKPISLDQKGLKNTVRKDVNIMFRGIVPDSWVAGVPDPQEIRSAWRWPSTRTMATNIIGANTPIVRIPTRASMITSTPIQRSNIPDSIQSRPIGLGIRTGPGVLPQGIPMHRPAPIITNTHHIFPTPYQCYSSSPLRYSYTISSPYSPSLRTPATPNPVVPANGPKKSEWVSGNRSV